MLLVFWKWRSLEKIPDFLSQFWNKLGKDHEYLQHTWSGGKFVRLVNSSIFSSLIDSERFNSWNKINVWSVRYCTTCLHSVFCGVLENVTKILKFLQTFSWWFWGLKIYPFDVDGTTNGVSLGGGGEAGCASSAFLALNHLWTTPTGRVRRCAKYRARP